MDKHVLRWQTILIALKQCYLIFETSKGINRKLNKKAIGRRIHALEVTSTIKKKLAEENCKSIVINIWTYNRKR